ncbi:16S rRNA (adenine(1518)-N(6)/adenine(1519)-N(6))-dimethyltransferase RsmA [uncultured Gulosibacter sp.]|uniref:16S rRNA (adenine(1518)-N(6)/adenine(1519)-N(6))- dimethyltransferase RsmA n=1 Tax=uncultured Gulosibacter sp. TaxID=1339167 RepID=UPI00288AD473|nr:16S rRNA (adenine(1518)-N(6)/adenine(1519)-N(6))-dimethyltransferase RsmA [uncultured Gulosibacter sp.]
MTERVEFADDVRLLGPAEVRELAGAVGVHPTKKLGQNFVHDHGTVRRIVGLARVAHGEHVLEVGPGLGSLTLALLAAGAEVTAIEIDARLARQLPETVAAMAPNAASRLNVIEQDALKITDVDGEPVALVANLPYNVSVPVLLHLLPLLPSLRRGVVMVQREVGERIAAEPGSRVYGAPSVKAAWFGNWKTLGLVGRKVFWPVPNVDSVLVSFTVGDVRGDDELRERTFKLVDAAFAQRRKMLRQALAQSFGSAAAASRALLAAGIAPTARGESLTIDDYVALARVDIDTLPGDDAQASE